MQWLGKSGNVESEIQTTIYITPLRNLRLLSISVVDYVQELTYVCQSMNVKDTIALTRKRIKD